MAITSTHYQLFKSLPLPRGGSLLEIGEANWYGDIEPEFPCRDKSSGFAIAKDCYAATFAPSSCMAIDMNGTEQALQLDLNERIESRDKFDVVINHGTAEHVFAIAEVFRTMHWQCEVGGLMIHDAPFTGWIDHGFYCLHPTLFYDLARANCYEIVKVAIHEIKSRQIIEVKGRDHVAALATAGGIPNNSMLFVAFRKICDAAFKVPMQGVYSQGLSEAGERAWRECR